MKIKYFAAIFTLIWVGSSCKKPTENALLQPEKDRVILSQYFSAATAGYISSMEPLTYVLNVPLAELPEDKILQNLIKTDPEVAGKITLTSGTLLKFTPDTPWENDKNYQISIDLRPLGAYYTDVLKYIIKTVPQEISISPKGYYINDDKSIGVSLSVLTSDKIDPEKLKTIFSTDAETVEVSREDDFEYTALFNYKRALKPSNYIRYDGSKIRANNKGKIDMSNFITREFKPLYSYQDVKNDVFYVYFSEIIDPNQDLYGIIQLNTQSAQVTIKNNRLGVNLSSIDKSKKNIITLNKSIASQTSKKLIENHYYTLDPRTEKPEVDFLNDGHYFPSNGEFKIPIKTHNLKEVQLMIVEIKQENVKHFLAWQALSYADLYQVRMYGRPIFNEVVSVRNGLVDKNGWKVYGIDLSNRIQRNPGSIYYISMDFKAEHTTLPCAENLRQFNDPSHIPHESYFDDKEAYNYRNYFSGYKWEERNNPCSREFYVEKQATNRLFICSDYGVLAKKAGEDYHVSLWDLMDLSPINNAEVTYYNLQGDLLGSVETSEEGRSLYNSSTSVPAILQVKKENKITYLSLDINESNALSEFDTEGQRSSLDSEFFIYTDRSFYRPGDSIYVALMVNKSQSHIPIGMPAVVKLFNPDNTLVQEQVARIDINSHLLYGFKLHTLSQAKTGTYRCLIEIGDKTITRNIAVETIKPNIAESLLKFNNEIENVIRSPFVSGSYSLKYLTGLPVSDAKVKAQGRATKIPQPFAQFKDYSFDQLESSINNTPIELFQLITDTRGQGKIKEDFNFSTYNHPLRISIEVEALLPGGGTTKEGSSVMIYPLKSYVGLKNKGGSEWWQAYSMTDDVKIDVVLLDDKGKTLNLMKNLTYTLYRNNSSWWMDSYYYGSRGHFNDSNTWEEVKKENINITKKGQIVFKSRKIESGEYKLQVKDPQSNHKSEITFVVVDSEKSHTQSKPHIAQIETDKSSYTTNEAIQIKLPEITNGKALISVETGHKIIEQKWYDISKNKNTVSLSIEDHWPSHVYLHATIVQPYMQDNNDLPLRMYGIQSVEIKSKISPLKPVANLPQTLESNKTYSFEINEAEGRPMEYTLALIDEGLLNISGFKTPQPKEHFSGKLPLLVKTWDVYKYLMNFFKGKFAGIISIGGDDAYRADAIPELNRYNPVVIYQGPYKIKAKGSQKHTLTIPNYIGKLRLMVVACSEDNFGHKEDQILVKNPLMLQSQFPRSLNVTDQISVPVNLIKNEKSIVNATLSAQSSPPLIEGWGKNRVLTFKGQEQILTEYNLKVKNVPGVSRIQLEATSGSFKMKEETEILVHYPHAFTSDRTRQSIEPGQSYTFKPQVRGYSEVYESYLTVSGVKTPNFAQYAQELISYPYGCLEQTASAGLSQLYLDKIIDLSAEEELKRTQNLDITIRKIASLQNKSGSFNYWDNDYYDTWSDIFAGDFLLEAHNLDYLADKKPVLDKWLKRQTSLANNWSLNASSEPYIKNREIFFQAYRLYILAKSGQPAKSALNRFVGQIQEGQSMVMWFIAGAYAYSGYDTKALDFISKGENIEKKGVDTENDDYYYDYSFGTAPRDKAIKVDILSRIGDKKAMEDYYLDMVDELNSASWVSTQTKGYAFMAVYKYYGKSISSTAPITYTLSGLPLNKNKWSHLPSETKRIQIPKATASPTIKVENTGKSTLYVHLTERYIDDNLNTQPTSSGLQMHIDYYNKSAGSSDLSTVKAGDDILITVQIKNLSPVKVSDLALNVKMPSGYELLNPRIYSTEVSPKDQPFNFQDYRDDRVYTFFNLKGQGKASFTFKARAAYKGDFYWPAITCENMYRGDIYAKSKSQRVKVQ